jgi:hypothetical protein
MDINIPSVIISHPQLNARLINYGYRNFIINGDFIGAQTKTEFEGDGGYLVDCWKWEGSSAIKREEKSIAEMPEIGGLMYAMKFQQNAPIVLYQKINDAYYLNSKTVTLSFLLKNEYMTTDEVIAELEWLVDDNIIRTDIIGTTTITNFGVWNKIVMTYTIPPIMHSATDLKANLSIKLPTGTIYITRVQLEIGDKETDFEFLPRAETWRRCHQKIIDDIRYINCFSFQDNFYFAIYFPEKMEDVPTVSLDKYDLGEAYNAEISFVNREYFIIKITPITPSGSGNEISNKRIKYRATTY